jgi:hypothetical protein
LNDPVNYLDIGGLQIMAGAEMRFYQRNPHLQPRHIVESQNAGKAIYDFTSNYNKMREANFIGSDKYFHCLANCESGKRGIGEKIMSSIISEGREMTDQLRGDPENACDADRIANNWGRNCPPDVTCKERCRVFRPTGLPIIY